MKTLLLDFETRSRVDLKAAGHRRYAADPSTSITCAAWQWRGRPETLRGAVFLPALAHLGSATKFDLVAAIAEADMIVCHNAGFDMSILAGVYGVVVPPEKISCTMARAQRLCLPGGLDALCEALCLPGKSKGGGLLVMRTCKPQRDDSFCEDEATFRDLLAYCAQDVRALADVDARLPELPPEERRIWERTWRKNELGLPVDLRLAETIAARRQAIEAESAAELRALSGHVVTEITQRQRIQKWLQSQQIFLKDLRRETVEEALESEDLAPDARSVLEMLRDSGGMAPTKAQALLDRHVEGRYKDATRYFGARSGRGTSEGVNTFNIARPSGLHDIETTIARLRAGFGDGLGNTALSDCLRGLICASPGKMLIDADLSNIEFRLTMWLAGEEGILDELRKPGGDPYMYYAKQMFRLPPDATKKTHPKERQQAKPVALGGTYGCGHLRFYGMYRRAIPGLTPEIAQSWVSGFRQAAPKLAGKGGLWRQLDLAAREAVWRPGRAIEAAEGRVSFCVDDASPLGRCLWLTLPSGRRLPHYAPRINDDGEFVFYRAKYGRMMEQRAFGGSWTEIICQSLARDIITRVEAIVEAELPDVTPLLDVYDSVILEAPEAVAEQRLAQVLEIMSRPIPWAIGLPVMGEGYCAERMKK